MEDRSVLLQVDDRGAAVVTLNRPQIHNAFDETMVSGLTDIFQEVAESNDIRVMVLQARGESFCAGADLNYMRRLADASEQENLRDAEKFARLLRTLYEIPHPTVALVQGATYGGGVGLTAACDMAVAVKYAIFALTETKLGLIPAIIGPYIVEAIGARQARRYFLTAERFSGFDAQRIGLVHEVVSTDTALQAQGEHIIDQVLKTAPEASAESKRLVREISGRPIDEKLMDDMVRRIAKRRAAPEGKEGMAAFLDHRKPSWVP